MDKPHQIVFTIKAEVIPVQNDGQLSGIPVYRDRRVVTTDLLSLDKAKELASLLTESLGKSIYKETEVKKESI